MDKRRGFTLVELLVVIAIIALLMSILMPALGRVRRQAKSVLCQSNMKQWGNCYAMYADTWEGSTPAGWPSNWPYAVIGDYGSTGNNGWIADPPINVTPDDLGQDHPVAWNWRNFNISGAGQVPMHGGNQWIDAWPMVTDEIPLHEGESYNPYSDYSHMVRICLNRHDGFVNWVFMDYSVRPVGLKELWRFKWHRRYDSSKAPTMADFNIASGNYDGWMKRFKNYD